MANEKVVPYHPFLIIYVFKINLAALDFSKLRAVFSIFIRGGAPYLAALVLAMSALVLIGGRVETPRWFLPAALQ